MTTKDYRNGGMLGLVCGVLLSFSVIGGTIVMNMNGAKPLQQEVIELINVEMAFMALGGFVITGISLNRKGDKFLKQQMGDYLRGFLIALSTGFGGIAVVFILILPQSLPHILKILEKILS